jgi:hypothetical protein
VGHDAIDDDAEVQSPPSRPGARAEDEATPLIGEAHTRKRRSSKR